jgi:hypothetical protein
MLEFAILELIKELNAALLKFSEKTFELFLSIIKGQADYFYNVWQELIWNLGVQYKSSGFDGLHHRRCKEKRTLRQRFQNGVLHILECLKKLKNYVLIVLLKAHEKVYRQI